MSLNYTDDNAIDQTERLYTVRPRSSALDVPTGGAGNRGTRAKFQLLTLDSASRNRNKDGFSSRGNADYILPRLENQRIGFTDFLLTSFDTSMSEKVQITPTFGDSDVVYYFGKAPVVMNLTGILIDDLDNQWFTTFCDAYLNIMRGSQLARNYELIQLHLPNMVVTGSIMSLSITQSSDSDTNVHFTMQVHAKDIRLLPVQLPGVPLSNPSSILIEKAKKFVGQEQINKLKTYLPMFGGSASGILSQIGKIEDTSIFSGDTMKNVREGIASSSTALNQLRASVFSPIYSILTSITRIVKGTTGDITTIIGAFTNPVNTILRDIRGVSATAIGVVKLIENSVNQIVNVPNRTLLEFRATLSALKNTAGLISRTPETISATIKRLYKSGTFKTGAAFLTKNGASLGGKTALLSSGKPYTPQSGAKLRQ